MIKGRGRVIFRVRSGRQGASPPAPVSLRVGIPVLPFTICDPGPQFPHLGNVAYLVGLN